LIFKRTFIVVVFLFFIVSSQVFAEESYEDIYLRLFGKLPENIAQVIDSKMKINSRFMGMVSVKSFTVDSGLLFNKDELDPFFLKTLKPPVFEKYKQLVANEDGLVTVEQLETVGVYSELDRISYIVDFSIDPSLINETVISFKYEKAYFLDPNSVSPAVLSSFLNLNLSGQSRRSLSEGTDTAASLPVVTYDNVTGFKKWMLKTNGAYQTKNDISTLGVNQVSASRYFPEKRKELIVGDVLTPGGAFFSSPPTMGIGQFTSREMLLGKNVSPTFFHRVKLTSPSQVTIYRNGQILYSKNLMTGAYKFSDIELTTGRNTFEVVVVPKEGEKTINTEVRYYFGGLLNDTHTDYVMSVGMPYSKVGQQYDFEDNTPIFSGLYRYGFRPNMTLSNSIQTDSVDHVLGMSMIRATKIGPVNLDIAESFQSSGTNGSSLRFGYGNYFELPRRDNHYFGGYTVNWVYTGKDFSQFSGIKDFESQDFNRWGLSFGTVYIVDRTFQIKVNAQSNTNSNQGFTTTTLSFSKLLRNTAVLTWSIQNSISELSEWAFTFDYVWQIPDNPLDIGVKRNIKNRSTTIQGSYKASKTVEYTSTLQTQENVTNIGMNASFSDFNVGGNYINNNDATTKRLNTQYNYEKLRASVGLSEQLSSGGSQDGSQNLDYNIGTSIVFADKHLAFTQQVRSNFVLFVPTEHLEGDPVVLTNGKKSGFFKSVVHPDMSVYQKNNLGIDGSFYSQEKDVGPLVYTFVPNHGSGYIVKVGAPPKATLRGALKDSSTGEPISLIFGQATFKTNENSTPIEFFTDFDGEYEIIGLSPGKYEVTLGSGEYKPVIINVSSKKERIQYRDIEFESIQIKKNKE
jgi:outer membrane usher protein FimD/PapC